MAQNRATPRKYIAPVPRSSVFLIAIALVVGAIFFASNNALAQQRDAGPLRQLGATLTAQCIADSLTSIRLLSRCLCIGKDKDRYTQDPAVEAAGKKCVSDGVAYSKIVDEKCGLAGAFNGDEKAACGFQKRYLTLLSETCLGSPFALNGSIDLVQIDLSWLAQNQAMSLYLACLDIITYEFDKYKTKCNPEFSEKVQSPSTPNSPPQTRQSTLGGGEQGRLRLSALSCASR